MDAAYPMGFIGLGTMGEAMALTLVKAGTPLLVWNRTRAKAEILRAAGADVAREAADVFACSATVFLMLVDGGAIEREMIRERVCAGVKNARHKGKRLGRPKKIFDRQRAVELRQQGLSLPRIARELGVGLGDGGTVVRTLTTCDELSKIPPQSPAPSV